LASYISVPRDLTKVKTKVFFNLTKRQLICFSIGVAVGVPIFFLLKMVTSISTATMGMMVVMMPMFFMAMYEKNGQPLEKILGHFIRANFIRPKKRPYKTDNDYAAIIRQMQINKEVRTIVEAHKPFSEEGKKADQNAEEPDKGRAAKDKDNH